jgi:hypothetical protein
MNGGKGSHWKQQRQAQHAATRQISPSRSLRSVWKRLPSPWVRKTTVSLPAPRVLYVVLRDVDPAADAAFNQYLDGELVPEIVASPGFLSCERYEAGEVLAATSRANQNIAQPRFMEIYDVATPEVLNGGAFRALQASPSATGLSLKSAITIRGCGVYMQRPSPWLVDFAGH